MAKKLASTKAAKKSTKKTATEEGSPVKKAAKNSAKRPAPTRSVTAESGVQANSFAEMSARYNSSMRDIADRLRALVRDVLPEAEELIYWGEKVGIALYSIGGASQVICGVQIQEDGCLLYIHN